VKAAASLTESWFQLEDVERRRLLAEQVLLIT